MHYSYIRMVSKILPRNLFKKYACQTFKKKLTHLYFILSFDCDTEEDILSAWDVHQHVTRLGVTPIYAIPGQILEKGSSVFKRILDNGGEFINHGYTKHAFYNTVNHRYESCFFYDQLSNQQIREDVIKGDQAIRTVLGIQPEGFRVPHFGRFQKPSQQSQIYCILNELGYRYSTSTMPYYGFVHGAMMDVGNLIEFPLSGGLMHPLSVLDTWAYFKAPDRIYSEREYAQQAHSMADYFTRNQYPGILNYYADPNHIVSNDLFFKTIYEMVQQAESTTYTRIIKELMNA